MADSLSAIRLRHLPIPLPDAAIIWALPSRRELGLMSGAEDLAMPIVKGCHLPDHLLYDVDNHIWFAEQPDGTVKLGMTTVATAMAGQLVAFTPKKVGRSVDAGKSCATVESGKWVGPAKSCAAGEVVKVNDDLIANPALANADPYEKGWFVVLKPADWAAVKPTLVAGAAVTMPYEAKMSADGFSGCP